MSFKSKRIFYILLLSLLHITTVNAQNDSIKYSVDFKFDDGLFLSFEHVQSNRSIPFKNIITQKNILDPTILNDLFQQKTIQLFIDGEKRKILTGQIWGYSKNGVLYIKHLDQFYRIPSIGQISFFAAQVEVRHIPNVDPWNNSYVARQNSSYSTTELQSFLLDFNEGVLYEYSAKNVEKLISPNQELHQNFLSLKKRKRRQMAFIYIRRFNESRPLYFPKNN